MCGVAVESPQKEQNAKKSWIRVVLAYYVVR